VQVRRFADSISYFCSQRACRGSVLAKSRVPAARGAYGEGTRRGGGGRAATRDGRSPRKGPGMAKKAKKDKKDKKDKKAKKKK
jgi:hypothetical protein